MLIYKVQNWPINCLTNLMLQSVAKKLIIFLHIWCELLHLPIIYQYTCLLPAIASLQMQNLTWKFCLNCQEQITVKNEPTCLSLTSLAFTFGFDCNLGNHLVATFFAECLKPWVRYNCWFKKKTYYVWQAKIIEGCL